jgi:hypothetical protein
MTAATTMFQSMLFQNIWAITRSILSNSNGNMTTLLNKRSNDSSMDSCVLHPSHHHHHHHHHYSPVSVAQSQQTNQNMQCNIDDPKTRSFIEYLTSNNNNNNNNNTEHYENGNNNNNNNNNNNKAEKESNLPQKMTQREFEEKKRQLTILLDLSVQSKMKIEKAFPEKLLQFGRTRQDWDKYGLNWHPGWREPPRFVPEVDCDPYRGACMVQACTCDAFETWPLDDIDYGATHDPELVRTYVYNPRLTNPESDLCYVCHHLKSDHTLWTPTLEQSRSKLTEFNRPNVERYSIQLQEGLPPKHPMNIPQYTLQRYYDEHPDVPGASPVSSKLKLIDVEEEKTQQPKGLSTIMDSENYDELLDEDELFM